MEHPKLTDQGLVNIRGQHVLGTEPTPFTPSVLRKRSTPPPSFHCQRQTPPRWCDTGCWHIEEDLLRMECCTRAPVERFKRTGHLWQAVAPRPGEKMWLLPALATSNPIYQGASWSSIPWTNDLFTQGICSLPKTRFHLHKRGVTASSALSCKHLKPQPKALKIQIQNNLKFKTIFFGNSPSRKSKYPLAKWEALAKEDTACSPQLSRSVMLSAHRSSDRCLGLPNVASSAWILRWTLAARSPLWSTTPAPTSAWRTPLTRARAHHLASLAATSRCHSLWPMRRTDWTRRKQLPFFCSQHCSDLMILMPMLETADPVYEHLGTRCCSGSISCPWLWWHRVQHLCPSPSISSACHAEIELRAAPSSGDPRVESSSAPLPQGHLWSSAPQRTDLSQQRPLGRTYACVRPLPKPQRCTVSLWCRHDGPQPKEYQQNASGCDKSLTPGDSRSVGWWHRPPPSRH